MVSWEGSRIVGKSIWFAARKFRYACASLSMLTPTITSRGSRRCRAISDGSSSMHGAHQLAQKFTSTTRPRYWLRLSVCAPSCSVNAGAIFPSSRGLAPRSHPIGVSRHPASNTPAAAFAARRPALIHAARFIVFPLASSSSFMLHRPL